MQLVTFHGKVGDCAIEFDNDLVLAFSESGSLPEASFFFLKSLEVLASDGGFQIDLAVHGGRYFDVDVGGTRVDNQLGVAVVGT